MYHGSLNLKLKKKTDKGFRMAVATPHCRPMVTQFSSTAIFAAHHKTNFAPFISAEILFWLDQDLLCGSRELILNTGTK
jgi:hypothetical protein